MVVVAHTLRRGPPTPLTGQEEEEEDVNPEASNQQLPTAQLRALFSKYDADHSGTISLAELHQVVVIDLKTELSMTDLEELCEWK